ncbi:EfeM/EfeO family lipoprotein [Streptomyces sp. NPDC018610]|uniref:EfeM/EfeO family lipoprotein n=1 Tax=Streptomyces sp. NPDC018610 TaxID=3365049 RepID=UPI003796D7D5
MPMSRPGARPPRAWAAAGAALALVLAGLLVLVRASHRAGAEPDGLPHTTVEVAPGHCGRGWDRPVPGIQVFRLRNTSGGAVEAYLEERDGGAVLGETEGIGPGTTRTLTVRLGTGAYAFRCVPEDADAVTGPAVRVDGGRTGPAAAPVTAHDLVPPAIAYQKWVAGGLAEVVRLTGRLRDAVDRGDLEGARAAWLPAHLGYERLGAAYDAFGDADARINGTDAGLPGGVRDPSFTGFHRVEHGLWHGAGAGALRAPAAALAESVTALRDAWARERMDPAQLGRRAHEILENTVRFELTGRTDYGSGSNLATARANLDGTRAVLARLRPLLTSRYPGLPALDQRMKRAESLLDGFRHGDRWTPPARLSRVQRERTDAAFGDLVERLASVATLCEPRRTA